MDPLEKCNEAYLVHKVIRMLRISKRNEQCGLLKEIAPIIVYASEDDIRSLLLFTNTTNDVELLMKLFLLISIYLTNNGLYSELIITCDELYYKMHDILMKGLLSKYLDILYLMTAMTLCDEADGDSRKLQVVHYAKNIIRVSGCLGALMQFFLQSTLNKDTWQALCHCLAMCCRDSQMNQNYNSYLIPKVDLGMTYKKIHNKQQTRVDEEVIKHYLTGVGNRPIVEDEMAGKGFNIIKCIEMCNRGDVPVLSLILSLVNGNRANTNKFMNCRGLEIFTRNTLERESFLEILNALVQSSHEVVSELIDSYVPSVLTQLLRLHRGQTRIGQWCKVILHNIEINSRKNCALNDDQGPLQDKNDTYIEKSEDTTILYENVMKEINDWKHSNNYSVGTLSNFSPCRNVSCTTPVFANRITSLQNTHNRISNRNIENYSGSFVHNGQDRDVEQNRLSVNSRFRNSNINPVTPPRLNSDKTIFSQRLRTDIDYSPNYNPKTTFNKHSRLPTIIESRTISETNCTTNHASIFSKKGTSQMHLEDMHPLYNESLKVREPSIRSRQNYTNTDKACQVDRLSFFEQTCSSIGNFNPPLKSTPKHTLRRNALKFSRNESNIPRNYDDITKNNIYLSNKQKVRNIKLGISFKRPKNRSHQKYKEGTSKDTSLSTKLYKTINETCGTIYSKVKNIFSQSKNPEDSNISARNVSYSFTKYMTKRDAVLKYTDELQERGGHKQMLVVHSCHTCNDTELLQNKLKCNPEFKDTIDKLKMGLRQYGCDFEKISNTLWPDEPYMTPNVVYNFYKKLILK